MRILLTVLILAACMRKPAPRDLVVTEWRAVLPNGRIVSASFILTAVDDKNWPLDSMAVSGDTVKVRVGRSFQLCALGFNKKGKPVAKECGEAGMQRLREMQRA